jgi:hypothetical protein
MYSYTVKDLGVTFEVGKTYNNQKLGDYVVLSILNNEKMSVKFANEVRDLNIRIAANQIFNQQCEIAKALNKKTIKVSGTENQIAYTIGRIAVLGRLFVDGVKDKQFEDFKYRYEKATGDIIEKIENITLLCDDANKWGITLAISLPKDFVENDYFALPENTNIIEIVDGTYCIYDNKFWWALVENFGFVLGRKQNLSKIENRMPNQLKNYFVEGIKDK